MGEKTPGLHSLSPPPQGPTAPTTSSSDRQWYPGAHHEGRNLLQTQRESKPTGKNKTCAWRQTSCQQVVGGFEGRELCPFWVLQSVPKQGSGYSGALKSICFCPGWGTRLTA